ncbi:MAG TPA: response regulator transcription factor [Anseongella sp.]
MIKVGIVDDHTILVDGLKKLIGDSGIAEVNSVSGSAAECRSSLGFRIPDVLMLDISLPDASGIDLCKELKEKYPGLKILALSSYGEYAVVRQMLDNGASGYVIKNAMPKEIMEGIKTVAAGEKFLSHEVDLLLRKQADRTVWLSDRERELLRLVAEGYTNPEIAERIFLSAETIRGYRKNLLLKLGAKNTAVLVKMAIEQKLI